MVFKFIKSIAKLFKLTSDTNKFKQTTDFNFPDTTKYSNRSFSETPLEFTTDQVDYMENNGCIEEIKDYEDPKYRKPN